MHRSGERPLRPERSLLDAAKAEIPALLATGDFVQIHSCGALVHNSRSRSIIALHPEIRGPA